VTATRTVLFTDLANYTAKVSGTDREGLRRILREHEQMVRPIVERRNGRIIKNIGDSFLCLFPAATDALRAALEVQDSTRDGKAPTIRIAVTTGDVEEIDGDAFGEPVNIAARILGITPAEEIWFGTGTWVCMNDAEIPWESVGFFRLKGIPAEQQCFRMVPEHKAWLPHGVADAAKAGRLVRLRAGAQPPPLPPDPIVMFEGFDPESKDLQKAVQSLPVLSPAAFYLAAYKLSGAQRQAWTQSGYGLVIGTSKSINAAVKEAARPPDVGAGTTTIDDSSTMALDVKKNVELELALCGLALPGVPLSEVVESYSYELLPDGRWVTRSNEAVLRIIVRPDQVGLQALGPGVSVAGRLLASGESIALQGDVAVSTPSTNIRFRAARGGYRGILLQDSTMRLGVMRGQTAELGRKPNPPGLAFPGRDGQDNIRWCSGPRAARARSHNFTLDRVLTGRRQAAVTVGNGAIQLVPLHTDCPTYLLRGKDGIQAVKNPVSVKLGDIIIAGTNIVALRLPE